MLRRPQDYRSTRLPALIELARERKLTELYGEARVRIGERASTSRSDVQYTLPLNKWSANQPGTTYFLPIAELTAFTINSSSSVLDEGSVLPARRAELVPAGRDRPVCPLEGRASESRSAPRPDIDCRRLETLSSSSPLIEQGGMFRTSA